MLTALHLFQLNWFLKNIWSSCFYLIADRTGQIIHLLQNQFYCPSTIIILHFTYLLKINRESVVKSWSYVKNMLGNFGYTLISFISMLKGILKKSHILLKIQCIPVDIFVKIDNLEPSLDDIYLFTLFTVYDKSYFTFRFTFV